jgi:hypothetical protein
MATICLFQHVTKNKTANLPAQVIDRDIELTAIIAAAELAFDKVYSAREGVAA